MTQKTGQSCYLRTIATNRKQWAATEWQIESLADIKTTCLETSGTNGGEE